MLQIFERPGVDGLPDAFLELPPIVYANEPAWIPEDPEAVRRKFGPQSSWFEQGQCQLFWVPGKARLATFMRPALQLDGAPAAYFGYWETTGEVDAELFAAAERWAKARGAKELIGPINFNTFGAYRVRLSAEEGALTFPGEPFNPKSYPKILEGLGYTVGPKYVTQLAPAGLASMVRAARRPLLDKVLAQGFRIEALTHQLWLDNLPQMHALVDEIFQSNFGYEPLSFEGFAEVCGEKFARKSCPISSVIAYDADDAVAGFFLVYPHWGRLVNQIAGADRIASDALSYDEHFPLLRALGPVDAFSKTVAVSPNHRHKGVMTALTVSMFERGEGLFERWYGALIGEANFNRRYDQGLAEDSRWYAVFRKGL